MGIIPRPLVMRPIDNMKGVKKIGYFPHGAVERIEQVKRLKKQGFSIDEIRAQFKNLALPEALPGEGKGTLTGDDRPHPEIPGDGANNSLQLTLDTLSDPAYFLNHHFHVVWANHLSREKVFLQNGGSSGSMLSKNVFQWIFNWKLHSVLQNWKDLLRLHMSYAKTRVPREWVNTAYNGISANEIEILTEFYDKASPGREKDIQESHIHFLRRDGITESYRVLSMSFREGRLFVYLSSEGLAPW